MTAFVEDREASLPAGQILIATVVLDFDPWWMELSATGLFAMLLPKPWNARRPGGPEKGREFEDCRLEKEGAAGKTANPWGTFSPKTLA